ncbi:hypothetical protein BGZ96_009244 [Linnemannia gamsii]|uniref:Uncharacterized protein n=1 Tax=Linnemannia gamsii TaxID=64522 RepID=A0ABQ7JXA4_9FUNG|nr:hypothetical protein BGZ96_009244 [Linnemannia gamsii]
MIANKLLLVAVMCVAFVTGAPVESPVAAEAAEVFNQKRAGCLPMGASCSVIPNVNGPRCCTFLVCDLYKATCKSGIVIRD